MSEKASFFKGTRTVILTNSAFDTGIQTGLINGLKFEEIQAINNVYTLQSAYKDFSNLLLSGLINTISFQENDFETRNFYGFLAVTMTDVVIQEQKLMQDYDDLLKKIEPK